MQDHRFTVPWTETTNLPAISEQNIKRVVIIYRQVSTLSLRLVLVTTSPSCRMDQVKFCPSGRIFIRLGREDRFYVFGTLHHAYLVSLILAGEMVHSQYSMRRSWNNIPYRNVGPFLSWESWRQRPPVAVSCGYDTWFAVRLVMDYTISHFTWSILGYLRNRPNPPQQ